MAGSRKSKPNLLVHVAEVLSQHVRPEQRLILGLSGGRDSVALLDILYRLAPRLGFSLAALHVNHQLSRNACHWEGFCRELAADRGVPLVVERVAVDPKDPRGLEAAARDARYAAFARCKGDFLVLAHHQDDQAETLLLQLLRGAGPQGLAAMPALRQLADPGRHAPGLLRPLLQVPRAQIEAYAASRRLSWVDDESNDDIARDRNYLRREVLPVVARRFPGYRQTLARAASHLAEASSLLAEVALQDAGGALRQGRLQLATLKQLAPSRRKNLLRWYLGYSGITAPSTATLEELLRQLTDARADRNLVFRFGDLEARRYRGELWLTPVLPAVDAGFCVPWHGEARLGLGYGRGTLAFKRGRGRGIKLAVLQGGAVSVRARSGGERFRPSCERPRRSLKNLLQEQGVPPWQRFCLPLMFCGDALVWVPGIGVDCAFQAGPGEPGLEIIWEAGDGAGAGRQPGTG